MQVVMNAFSKILKVSSDSVTFLTKQYVKAKLGVL